MTKRKGLMFGKIRGTSTTPSVRGQSAMQSMKNMTKFSSISLQFHFPVFHFKLLISYFHDASNQWKNKSIYILYTDYVIPDRLWTRQTLSYLSFEEILKVVNKRHVKSKNYDASHLSWSIWVFGNKENGDLKKNLEKMLNNTQNAIYF